MTASALARHRGTVLVAAVGSAVLLAALVAIAVRDDGDDQLVAEGGSLAATEPCPERLPVADDERSVAAPPAPGPSDRLVPQQVPTAVLVCRYEDTSIFGPTGTRERPTEVELDAERVLTAGLERLPDDLAVPRGEAFGVCSSAGGPTVPYLLRLDYPRGPVWLSTSTEVNSCAVVTNGAFTAASYVGRQVEASYDARAWVPEPALPGLSETPCPRTPTGRAGQEQVLVPQGWDELVVCRSGAGSVTARQLDGDAARRVADLLLSLPTAPREGLYASCDQRQQVSGLEGDPQFELLFTYPRGRGVRVIPFLGCDPPLGNGSLEGTPTIEQQAELLRLLRGD